MRRLILRTISLLALVALAEPASAWKPLTHGRIAITAALRAAATNADAQEVLAYQAHLIAGATGPDIFYYTAPDSSMVLSDIAHYCSTGFTCPYGLGRVVVTSSYGDWGGFNQTGPGARGIIRDTIAWAKRPNTDLPVHRPGDTVALTIPVKNLADAAISQVKLPLMSPSRDKTILETVVRRSIASEATESVDFQYAFPANAELGIYHLDYELLDAAGETIQPATETDDGRIVVANPATSVYKPADVTLTANLLNGEEMVVGEDATFRYRLSNRSGQDRTFRLYSDFAHAVPSYALAAEIEVAANSTAVQDVVLPVGNTSFNTQLFEPNGGTSRPDWCCTQQVRSQFGETGSFLLFESVGFRPIWPSGSGRRPLTAGRFPRETARS